MNKIVPLSLLFACVALAAPVPLDEIPGVNLAGVSLEMTRAELVAVRPQAKSVVSSGNFEQFVELVPDGPAYFFEFWDGKLVHVIASPGEMPASQRAQQTQVLLNALTTRFGAPTRVAFGRIADGAAHQVAGAEFDLSSEYSHTRGLLESNEITMRVSIFKTDVEPPLEISIPFAQVLEMTRQQSPPPPPVRDFLNELLP